MNFKLAYIRLTVFYVVIIMIVSIIFSYVIYEISSQEIDRGLGRQDMILRSLPPAQFQPQSISSFEQARIDQLNESNDRLKINLLYFNLAILVVSAGVSYFLARRTLKPIQDIFEVQNRFTADASHELRTPLTAMRTEIEVNLRDDQLNISDAKKLLKSNLEEIAKLEDLSNGLLTLAQYRTDKTTDIDTVDLRELIGEVIAKVEALAKTKDIKITQKLQPISILGNSQSLSRLLVIIMDNAIKYSPKASGITISLSASGKQAIIKIKDQGIGIKATDLPYIYNPFYRADHSRSKISAEGYGLGLSIAKQIVDFHQGKIDVESKPNSGSTFIIHLPKSS